MTSLSFCLGVQLTTSALLMTSYVLMASVLRWRHDVWWRHDCDELMKLRVARILSRRFSKCEFVISISSIRSRALRSCKRKYLFKFVEINVSGLLVFIYLVTITAKCLITNLILQTFYKTTKLCSTNNYNKYPTSRCSFLFSALISSSFFS